MNTSRNLQAWLFDLYPQRDHMVLWFMTPEGERLRLIDPFAPSFFVSAPLEGANRSWQRLRKAVDATGGLELLGPARRLDFWTGRPREVEEIRVTDLDRYGSNLRALFRRFPEFVYFDCDIAPEIHYGYERGIFPTARCAIQTRGDRLTGCIVQDDPLDTKYALPPLRIVELKAEGALAGRRPRLRSLTLTFEGRSIVWEEGSAAEMLASLRDCLGEVDPDLIWTTGGDSVLMPALFALAEHCKIRPLGLDREPDIERRLVFDGRSYISYGRVLYQAPDYPLFGRWHIDRNNSFWAGETGLEGLLEVARMSKIPVQRAARRSIGTGISSIQLDYAYRARYLIPWKKSRPEAWKTAATLLKADRGGLVYQPITGVYEDVIELDFVSMYPSIMVRCNVSPETINCACCGPASPDGARPGEHVVPELGYSICRRRRGLVSRALEPIIEKRRQLKRLMKKASRAGQAKKRNRYDGRQSALKWLLVCCFGYLGYRNARFGRIEAHEAICAFSREKLITAREICEERGFRMIHAIVDCVWIQRTGASAAARGECGAAEIEALCEAINRATDLSIAVEGRYRWIVFLPSRQNPDMPVPNRYFGCFEDGELKYRGIEIRRSDQAPYVQRVQGELLDCLRAAGSLAECRAMGEELTGIVSQAERRLRAFEVPIDQLVLRRKTSREAHEYKSNAMTAVAARQAVRAGFSLHAGEAVRFLVINAKDRDPDSRIRLVGLLRPEDAYDREYYIEQLRRAAATILDPLLGRPSSGATPKGNKDRSTRSRGSSRRSFFGGD
ncbi:hypothetical protein IIC65_00560 [Candidatus Sumerlaeota bacterium]|nr:hypothetical protein [Candidatus Sumerlaeota bacterium]